MALDAKQRHTLKKFVAELDKYHGRHTELVSVYIPKGYDLNKIINHLSQEQGTASNIKSASTRKNVTDALERMIQHLRLYNKTPENGLAVFSGNVAEREGQQDFKVWSIEPPVPLNTRIYRCDKDFVLDLLVDMLDIKEIFGLMVMDRREGVIGVLKGKSIIVLAKYTSAVPGKQRSGGQSAQRFERLREGAAKEFYIRLGDHLKEAFFNNKNLKGLLVGGPGPTKYAFTEGPFIPTELRNKIIAVKDLTYTDEFGLEELVAKSADVLAEEGVSTEKKLVNRFFGMLATEQGKVTYGEAEVLKVLKMGVVDILLLSESLDDEKIDSYSAEAEKFGTTIEIISVETNEGEQLRQLGGYGAILRYEVGTT